jgi:hypothetical protein
VGGVPLIKKHELILKLNAYISDKRKRRQDTKSSGPRQLAETPAVYEVNQQEPDDNLF